MAYYANQKTVIINKPEVAYSTAKTIIGREVMETAARELTGNEFKLYMFFASDMSGFKRDFSPAHFAETYGVSTDTARKLFSQLQDKGYLVKDRDKKNLYTFYTEPHKQRYSFKEEQRVDEDGRVLTFKEFYEEVKDYAPSEEAINAMWNTFTIMED